MFTLPAIATIGEILALVLLVAAILAPPAYFTIASIDLREGLAHWRAKQPCRCALLRGLAYLVLGLAALAH